VGSTWKKINATIDSQLKPPNYSARNERRAERAAVDEDQTAALAAIKVRHEDNLRPTPHKLYCSLLHITTNCTSAEHKVLNVLPCKAQMNTVIVGKMQGLCRQNIWQNAGALKKRTSERSCAT
jgi:hypothetical protein